MPLERREGAVSNPQPNMNSAWVGAIAIDSGQCLKEISIQTSNEGQIQLPPDASLRFLSIVETSRIPLFLHLENPYRVTTTEGETERWLSSILLGGSQNEDDGELWWKSARTDSPLAVLVAVDYAQSSAKRESAPRPTELLLYVSRDPIAEPGRPATPPPSSPPAGNHEANTQQLCVFAQPLCSDILQHAALKQPTPPSSPYLEDADIEPTFLPPYQAFTEEIINLPPVRKRKSLNDTFDEAAERRRKGRRGGGEGVAAAAAGSRTNSEDALPTLKHRRSVSNAQSVPLQSRPLSRASSVASGRLTDARDASVSAATKRSSLARIQSASAAATPDADPEEPTIEQKNKEIISKVVMAGMRLYGLVQSKNRKSRANSVAASPAVNTSVDDLEAERQKDEEYKLTYHQVYKGTCFAFRQHITMKSLKLHTEALRKAVDELLSIFCSDPLAVELGGAGAEDDLTPGGRKAFGSSAFAASGKVQKNPFLAAQQVTGRGEGSTPCGRKAGSERERDKAKGELNSRDQVDRESHYTPLCSER